MSEPSIISVEHAASLSVSNVSNGRHWDKCPPGKIQRIKAAGWYIYGTGGLSGNILVDTTFECNVPIDQACPEFALCKVYRYSTSRFDENK